MESRRDFIISGLPRLMALLAICQIPPRAIFAHSNGQPLGPRLTDSKYVTLLAELNRQHGFAKKQLDAWFGSAEIHPGIVDLFEKPSEDLPYPQYRRLLLNAKVTRMGRQYMGRNRDLFKRVQDQYRVDSPVIGAILGVESKFGRRPHAGFKVFEALNTVYASLARRESFARRELIEFLLLCREENLDPMEVKGSYAGAMGLPQFIPSSYRSYAVDYDRDGHRDLWNSDPDILASVANYLKRHGWSQGNPMRMITSADTQHPNLQRLIQLGIKAKTPLAALERMGVSSGPMSAALDKEQAVSVIASPWGDRDRIALLFSNFRTVMQYNRSINYALVVADLAEDLA